MNDPNVEPMDVVRQVRHDANGPLTAALGNVQILLEDPDVTPQELVETLREIEAELRRLSSIIRRLADVR